MKEIKMTLKSERLLAEGYDLVKGLTIPVGTSNKDMGVEGQEPENAEKRSQDLEPMFHDAGMFYFSKTEDLLKNIEEKGINIARVTLHVGIGTFRPVKVQNVEEHIMHSEHF